MMDFIWFFDLVFYNHGRFETVDTLMETLDPSVDGAPDILLRRCFAGQSFSEMAVLPDIYFCLLPPSRARPLAS